MIFVPARRLVRPSTGASVLQHRPGSSAGARWNHHRGQISLLYERSRNGAEYHRLQRASTTRANGNERRAHLLCEDKKFVRGVSLQTPDFGRDMRGRKHCSFQYHIVVLSLLPRVGNVGDHDPTVQLVGQLGCRANRCQRRVRSVDAAHYSSIGSFLPPAGEISGNDEYRARSVAHESPGGARGQDVFNGALAARPYDEEGGTEVGRDGTQDRRGFAELDQTLHGGHGIELERLEDRGEGAGTLERLLVPDAVVKVLVRPIRDPRLVGNMKDQQRFPESCGEI